MESMGVVSRDHKGLVDRAQIVLFAAAETAYNAAQQLGEHRRSGPLLGSRSGLFIVKHSHHTGLCRRRSLKQSSHSAVDHTQVIQATRSQKLIVKPHGAGGSGVEKREVEIKNVVHTASERVSHSAEQQIVLLGGISDNGYHRQHVFLLRERIALVDSAVEMDGKVRYDQQRAVEFHYLCTGMQRILAAEHGHRERTVEPCVENRATVDLHVQPDNPTIADHLGLRLDAQAGRVRVGRDYAETGVRAFGGHCKRENGA